MISTLEDHSSGVNHHALDLTSYRNFGVIDCYFRPMRLSKRGSACFGNLWAFIVPYMVRGTALVSKHYYIRDYIAFHVEQDSPAQTVEPGYVE